LAKFRVSQFVFELKALDGIQQDTSLISSHANSGERKASIYLDGVQARHRFGELSGTLLYAVKGNQLLLGQKPWICVFKSLELRLAIHLAGSYLLRRYGAEASSIWCE
jgi:hypothetical protein